MDSKSIFVGIIIGILVGGVVGYTSAPAPDYTPYESQITQFQSQALSLSKEIDDLEYQLIEAPSQEDYIELQQQVSILEASVNSADFNINLLTEEVASLESEISDFEAPVEFEFVTVSFSRPEDTSSLLQYWIGKANVTIQLMVMLTTQDELASSLIDAHERGVDVDVIIDDDWYSSSGSDYQDILDAGIDIRGDERGVRDNELRLICEEETRCTGDLSRSIFSTYIDPSFGIMTQSVFTRLFIHEWTGGDCPYYGVFWFWGYAHMQRWRTSPLITCERPA